MGSLSNVLSLYRGKRVLVTGDTGFKGSWLSLWLYHLGAEVTGYALPPKGEKNHFRMIQLKKLIHHVDGDICDFERLKNTFSRVRPHFVFHLAAQSNVYVSYREPKMTFETNVTGGIRILETVRTTPSLRALVYVTSDKCYKNKELNRGYREDDELGGRDPYSASKASAELMFLAYLDSFFSKQKNFGAATARAGNVIGGGDWSPHRVIPDCIRALQKGKPVVLRNPDATRPWQHVLEPLYGYLLLGTRLYKKPQKYSGSWNFGPAVGPFTVGQLVQKAIRHWGSGKIKIAPKKNRPYEAKLLQLNCDKAHRQLGWRPRWDFDRTVLETVSWYKKVGEGDLPLTVGMKQIKNYMHGKK